MACSPALTICTACAPVNAPSAATYGSEWSSRQNRSAPRRASVCSTWNRPRSRSTSAASYGRSIPAHLWLPFVAAPLMSSSLVGLRPESTLSDPRYPSIRPLNRKHSRIFSCFGSQISSDGSQMSAATIARVVLVAFLASLAVVLASTAFATVRAIALWRQTKRTGGALGGELASLEEKTARAERHLAEWESSSRDLEL